MNKYYVVCCGAEKTDPSIIFGTNNKRVAEKRARDEKKFQNARNNMIKISAFPYRPEGQTNYSFFVVNTTNFSKRNTDDVLIVQCSAIVYKA